MKAQNTCSPPVTHFGLRLREFFGINTLVQKMYIGRNSQHVTPDVHDDSGMCHTATIVQLFLRTC